MGYVVSVVLLNGILMMGIVSRWEVVSNKTESECIVFSSRMQSQFVPYTETYKSRIWGIFYRIKSRTNYKIQFHPVWFTEKKCCTGYQKVDTKCLPICTNPCVHGQCTKSNTCSCKEGYGPSSDPEQKHVCKPLCEGNCRNGFCIQPNECICEPGYRLTEDKLGCLPICQKDCEKHNAHCLTPDLCICNPGYQLADPKAKDANDMLCTPVCEQPCVNGKCTEPYGVCTCDLGYQLNKNVCEPNCSEPCVMGTCIAPEVCSCNHGYGLLGNSSYVCEPICKNGCINGTCTSPGVCTCHDGYKPSDNDTMKHVCEPFCKKACINGACTAPEVCNCTEGYRFNGTTEEEYTCVPFCNVPCEPHGLCVAPHTCKCFHGYRMVDTNVKENEIPSNITVEHTSACEPICNQSCANGRCTEPDNCTCDEGYAQDTEGQCKPSCSSCYNGTCVAPNVCQCLEGFILTNESACVPFCENSCRNGECVAPNECRCQIGYEMSGNGSTCVKPCTRVCKGHGICVEDEKPCECSYGWTGWDCTQPTVCILLMDLNDKSLSGITIYHEANDNLTDARRYAPYCYHCNETVGNGSVCFAVTSDEGPSSVGCFVETESPCYLMYHSSTYTMSRMVGTLAAVTILIMATATTTVYFVIRRHQRRKIHAAIVQSALFQGSIANESLLSEENIQDASSTLDLLEVEMK